MDVPALLQLDPEQAGEHRAVEGGPGGGPGVLAVAREGAEGKEDALTEEAANGRTLVVGDIHGAARALEQVLESARFDPAADRLVCLGDVCDGWPEVDRCIDLLLGLERLVLILGNHDEWALEWMRNGVVDPLWFRNGGDATLDSYARRLGLPDPAGPTAAAELSREVPPQHVALLAGAVDYLIEERPDGRRALFVHAGWNPRLPPERQSDDDLRWSRNLWNQARFRAAAGEGGDGGTLTGYDVVFLGHTPTHPEWDEPRRVLEIWNLDQGAGWDGRLTVMDADTHEPWQSDLVPGLYPGVPGRMGG